MKKPIPMTKVILAACLFSSIIGFVAPKATAQMDDCVMVLDTLEMCITHHWEMGQIHSNGVYNSLLSKVASAVSANDRGQTSTAINILNAFINQVSAQSGKKIDFEAAEHMIMHANSAITDLQNP
jgi:FIMAH domain